jgi:hypothetical protein
MCEGGTSSSESPEWFGTREVISMADREKRRRGGDGGITVHYTTVFTRYEHDRLIEMLDDFVTLPPYTQDQAFDWRQKWHKNIHHRPYRS